MSKAKYYTLKVKKQELLDSGVNKDYYSLLRFLFYYSENYWAPYKISYEPVLAEQIEGEVLGNRLGLIMFDEKENKEIPLEKGSHNFSYELVNEESDVKNIYSKELEGEFLKPLDPNELVMKLKPNSRIKINIEFRKGNGSNHARFSKIEGFSFKQEGDLDLLKFELTESSFDKIWEKTKTLIEEKKA